MQVATSEAQRGSHESISTGHILLGLIKEHYSAASCALRLVGCDLDEIRREVAAILEPASRPVFGRVPRDASAEAALHFAGRESLNRERKSIESEHLLLGILHDRESVAARVLHRVGVNVGDLYDAVTDYLTRNASESSTDR